jgi:hypothetical protein
MTHQAVPAWRKGRGHKGPTIKKRRRKGLECNNGIKDRGTRWLLGLVEGKDTRGRIFRKTIKLDIEKQIVWTFIRLRRKSIRALWRARPLPNLRTRRQKHGPWKMMMVVHLDWLAPYQATIREEQP